MKFFNFLMKKMMLVPEDEASRWVVLDVETTGLNMHSDRLLAIAAIAVYLVDGKLSMAFSETFEVALQNEVAIPDKGNILLHGIGVGAQRQGMNRAKALREFEQFVGNAPLLAFHAAFDQTMITRAFKEELGYVIKNQWLDIEPLAGVLFPNWRIRSLDEYLTKMGIMCIVRHQAAGDTMATAELLLKLWPAAARELGVGVSFSTIKKLADSRKWLNS